jgi:hypothetical protein
VQQVDSRFGGRAGLRRAPPTTDHGNGEQIPRRRRSRHEQSPNVGTLQRRTCSTHSRSRIMNVVGVLQCATRHGVPVAVSSRCSPKCRRAPPTSPSCPEGSTPRRTRYVGALAHAGAAPMPVGPLCGPNEHTSTNPDIGSIPFHGGSAEVQSKPYSSDSLRRGSPPSSVGPGTSALFARAPIGRSGAAGRSPFEPYVARSSFSPVTRSTMKPWVTPWM